MATSGGTVWLHARATGPTAPALFGGLAGLTPLLALLLGIVVAV